MAGPDIANIVTIAALIVVSCLVTYLGAQHTLTQAKENSREQLELRLAGISGAIEALELRVAQLSHTTAALSAAAARSRASAPANPAAARLSSGAVAKPPSKPAEEISAEMMIVIGAAVTSFLGKPVRIRSAKMLQSPYEIVNPWAQQGRVIVQASHHLQLHR